MTPSEIHEKLSEIRKNFPKSSKMFVGFIERADKTGAMEGSVQRGSVISMKSAWQLENKAPTARFLPTDEKVIEYTRQAAANAQNAACKLMVVIDMSANSTDVWIVPKGGPCFVATAACGNPLAAEVVVLSTFRDEVLVRRRTGRAFVRLYYLASPPLAALIKRFGWLRRAALLVGIRPAVHAVRRWWLV